MLSAIGFVLFNCTTYIMAFRYGPIWALFAYMNIYFNPPHEMLNWWASIIPFQRWSLLTSVILVITVIIHKNKLSTHALRNTKWGMLFFALSVGIYATVKPYNEAGQHLYMLFTYCIIMYFIVRIVNTEQQLKLVYFAIVCFIGILSLDAYTDGNRINSRLEGTGSADAFGSNEFALLLAATIPLIVVFIKNGLRYEKIAAFCTLPFALNALVLCNSRGSFVALAGAVAIATLLIADKKLRRGMVALGIISIPVLLYLADDEFISRFNTLLGVQEAMDNQEDASALSSGRTEIWIYGLEMVKDNPLGIGPNGFKQIARFYMPAEILTFIPGNPYGVRSAHNTYIQVAVEQGFVGFFLWIIMCLHTSGLLYRSFKLSNKLKTPSPFLRDSIFAANIGFFSILLGGMLNSRVYYEFFWWQLAFAAVMYSIIKNLYDSEQENT